MMKQLSPNSIGIGILAGIIAAIICYVVINVFLMLPLTSILLGCFISLPIFIAAFGWGTLSSAIAILSASIILTILFNGYLALGSLLLFFGPAFYAAWLLGLANSDEQGKIVQWYPLSMVIFNLTSFIAIMSVCIGVFISIQPDTPIFAEKMADMVIANLQLAETPIPIDINTLKVALASYIVPILASMLAAYGLILLLGNLYFSLKIAQKMQRIVRPSDDWPSNLYLPMKAIYIFAVAFIASFFDLGPLFNIAAFVFNTSFNLAFCITGFAYLHNLTRGMVGRSFILAFFYIAFFTLILTAPISLILLLMGIWSTIQHNRNLVVKT